ncbi:MAG: pyridoxine 5'-phosphate synthase [Pseudomonadota bacterium]
MSNPIRLGVNIDHVATIRNARGGEFPCPVRAAILAEQSGADGITAHLREDRRHIKDSDIERLIDEIKVPLNFEMAATEEMQHFALKVRPHAVCIVPEKRQEITTEGGLDVVGGKQYLQEYIKPLRDAGIRVSLFVDCDTLQIEAAAAIKAPVIELHTGHYCKEIEKLALTESSNSATRERMLIKAVRDSAIYAKSLGLECHAGHGISFATVSEIAAINEIVELNIGHFLVGEAIFIGFKEAIRKMKALMAEARK